MSAYTYEIFVPGAVVPAIIGKNGLHIQKLRDIFHVKLIFVGENSGIYKERILRIQGLSNNVELARKKIEDIIKDESNIYDLFNENDAFAESDFFVPIAIAEDVIGFEGKNLIDVKNSLNLLSLEMQGTCCNEEGECLVLKIQGSVEKVSQAIQLLQRSSDAFMSAKNQFNANVFNENNVDEETVNDYCLNTTTNNNHPLKDQTSVQFKTEDDFVPENDTTKVDSPDLSRFALRLTEINTANFQRICKENYNAALRAAMEVFVNSNNNKEKVYFELQRNDLLSEIKKLQNSIQIKDNRIDEILTEVDQLQKEKQNFALMLRKLQIKIEAMNGSDASDLICKMCNTKPQNVVLMPCHHQVICHSCALKITNCICCNTKILSLLKVKWTS